LTERHTLEIHVERADQLFLDEDSFLECLPAVRAAIIGELGVGELPGIVGALDDIAVRVARIAVAAAELAADIRIERPVFHPGRAGGVEDSFGLESDESRTTQAFVEDGVGQSDGLTV